MNKPQDIGQLNEQDMEKLKEIIVSFHEVKDGHTEMGTEYCTAFKIAMGGCPLAGVPTRLPCMSFNKCNAKVTFTGYMALRAVVEIVRDATAKQLLEAYIDTQVSSAIVAIYELFIRQKVNVAFQN